MVRRLLVAVLVVAGFTCFTGLPVSAHEGPQKPVGCTSDGVGSRRDGNWGRTWCVMGKNSDQFTHEAPAVSIVQAVAICVAGGQPNDGDEANATDGYFGSGTESWVKQYQAKRGLVSDGIVGAATLNAMAKDIDYIGKAYELQLFDIPAGGEGCDDTNNDQHYVMSYANREWEYFGK